MNNKIIEFLSKREQCDHEVSIFNGKKETFNELLNEFPTKSTYHRHLDASCCHSRGAYYPNLQVTIYVNYNEKELKERAREIALAGAEKSAESACMKKWRETQKAKKE